MHLLDGAGVAADAVKYIGHLGKQGDARLQGYSRALQPLRAPVAVPVLVQTVDAGRVALAAGKDELGRQSFVMSSKIHDMPIALLQALPKAGMGEHKTGDLHQVVGVHALDRV